MLGEDDAYLASVTADHEAILSAIVDTSAPAVATPRGALRTSMGPPAAVASTLIAAGDLLALGIAASLIGSVGWRETVVVGAVAATLVLTRSNAVRPVLRVFDHLPWLIRHLSVGVLLATPVIATAPDPGRLVGLGAVAVGLVPVSRTVVYAMLRASRRRGWFQEPTLIVGSGPAAQDLRTAFESVPDYGLRVVGTIESGGGAPPTGTIGELQDIPRLVEALDVRRVVVAPCASQDPVTIHALRGVVAQGVRLQVVPRMGDLLPAPSTPMVDVVEGFSLYAASEGTAPRAAWAAKRVLDLVGAALLLAVFFPILVASAVGVKLTNPGPVLFRQERIGRGGRPFTMYKFRTFPVDHVDLVFSLPHEACPIPFCRLLRRTSIDELPQLINVLRGDMSLVGPRPERPSFAEPLAEKIPGYAERHRVRGGITGLAQVHGFWGDTSVDERVRLDNRYIDCWSLWGDVTILARTLSAILRKTRA